MTRKRSTPVTPAAQETTVSRLNETYVKYTAGVAAALLATAKASVIKGKTADHDANVTPTSPTTGETIQENDGFKLRADAVEFEPKVDQQLVVPPHAEPSQGHGTRQHTLTKAMLRTKNVPRRMGQELYQIHQWLGHYGFGKSPFVPKTQYMFSSHKRAMKAMRASEKKERNMNEEAKAGKVLQPSRPLPGLGSCFDPSAPVNSRWPTASDYARHGRTLPPPQDRQNAVEGK